MKYCASNRALRKYVGTIHFKNVNIYCTYVLISILTFSLMNIVIQLLYLRKIKCVVITRLVVFVTQE